MITSVLGETTPVKVEKPFPKLMVAPASGSVFLMFDGHNGTRVHAGQSWARLCHGEWDIELEDYEGTVTLSNS